MAKKNKQEEAKAGAPEWMVTYSDMMTLLLCFFVLLFASSNLDSAKFQALSSSMGSDSILSGGATIGEAVQLGSGIAQLPNVDRSMNTSKDYELQRRREEIAKMASDFKTYFAENNLDNKIEVVITDDSVNLRFDEGILFDSGKAILKPEALDILSVLTEQLYKYPDNNIKVEGHTDNVPINTVQFPSNLELSAVRAISVVKYFIDEKQFAPARLSAEGFGEYRPRDTNDTFEGRAKNRRVEVRVMAKSIE